MKVKCDHRSKFSNLCNWKEEAWSVTGLFFSSGKGTAVDRLVWFVDLVNMLLISLERGEESFLT